ncbi:DUF1365 domain-containing protein [Candidatus Puniceispirillum sp.]|jgi:uncharacterized protein|uniref:DUF1365 domain-containing protein n=1 Tax=Candidatus Puniceispirillum sp. TaxID=2026719 RepID=UPI001EB60178|nr:DUF1365 domain-containing protein [Candidatus Puniceispirillum sp.]
MSACQLVISQIDHTRHGTPSHFLSRKGLSLWINLDQLDKVNRMSMLFSVDKFNLLSFRQRDHGENFKSKAPLVKLADYARARAAELCPSQEIASVHLLTFPRIFGLVFNPVSVYVLCDKSGAERVHIYEVRNTFGDMHSYIGQVTKNHTVMRAEKLLHVSPFFANSGHYRLKIRVVGDRLRLLMRYHQVDKVALTATLRGKMRILSSASILSGLISTGQWPLRPLVSIHIEAIKLWLKKVHFFSRPAPPKMWSEAKDIGKVKEF